MTKKEQITRLKLSVNSLCARNQELSGMLNASLFKGIGIGVVIGMLISAVISLARIQM